MTATLLDLVRIARDAELWGRSEEAASIMADVDDELAVPVRCTRNPSRLVIDLEPRWYPRSLPAAASLESLSDIYKRLYNDGAIADRWVGRDPMTGGRR
jgi:hypothetical protein